jgi:hypothetical protein
MIEDGLKFMDNNQKKNIALIDGQNLYMYKWVNKMCRVITKTVIEISTTVFEYYAHFMCYFRTSHTSLVHGKLYLEKPNFSVEISD